MAENNTFDFNEIYSELFSITTNNYLKISSNEISFEDKDIKNLLERCNNKLILWAKTDKLLNNIPSTITSLIIALNNYDKIKLDNLPSSIKELYITNECCTDDTTCFNIELNNLPPNLEVLVIDSLQYNQSIDNLPYSLKTLKINSNCFTNSLDNLPPNLECFELTHFITCCSNHTLQIKFDGSLYNLPYTLTKLDIPTDYINNTDIELFKKDRPNLNIEIKEYRNHKRCLTAIHRNKSIYDKLINICDNYPMFSGFCLGIIQISTGFYIGRILWK